MKKSANREYCLFASDQHYNNYIFYKDCFDTTPLALRATYQHLKCPSCGKIDEFQAFDLPFEDDIRIRSKDDMFFTSDDLFCLSDHARRVIESTGIEGIDFRSLPSNQPYSIAVPTVFVAVDTERAGFENEGQKCNMCGRYEGVFVGPLRESYSPPLDPMKFFVPSVFNESRLGRKFIFHVSDAIRIIIKTHKLKGVQFIPPTSEDNLAPYILVPYTGA